MKPAPSPAVDDALLHALVDGRLSAAQAQQLHARLDSAQQQQAAAWTRQRALLRPLHHDWLEQPLPDALVQAADRLHQARDRQRQWVGWGGMAAGWLLAFGLGWGLHGVGAGNGGNGGGGSGATLAAAPSSPLPSQSFAQQAAVAHAVYQPEQRHPVEVTAAQQDHLVQWLSKRLARPLSVPQLQAQGFELMGGRLLPGGSGARAQFMYQNQAGARITLYLGALNAQDALDAPGTPGASDSSPPPDRHAAAQATAFQFHVEGGVSSFYWVDQGFGYALSGQLPRPALQELATAVYHQLSAAPPADARARATGS